MSFIETHIEVSKVLLKNLSKEFSQTKTISTKTLIELDRVFRAPLRPALKLVDKRCVRRLTCPRGRVVYQVAGETKASYTCLPGSNFCTCYSYLRQVLRRPEILMCKHVLASRLAEALEKCEDSSCTDETMAYVLQSLM